MLLEQGNTQENIITALIDKAQSGDVRAFEVIRDTIGEKPTDKHENKISGCTEFQELYEAICKEKDYVR